MTQNMGLKTALAAGFIAVFSGNASAAVITNNASASGAAPGDPACSGGPGSGTSVVGAPATATYTASAPGCNVAGSATADGGYVSVVSRANSVPNSTGRLSKGTARASAGFAATNLFFTPDEGFTEAILSDIYGDTIEITMFATFSGSTSANVEENTFVTSNAGAVLEATVRFGTGQWSNIVSSGSISDAGPLTDFDSLSTSISIAQTVAWGAGSTVQMSVGSRASTSNIATNQSASAVANASNTLSFNTDGPAFALPMGFTVHAPELNIFDNQWIDPRLPDAPPQISAPGTVYLLLTGGLALSVLRRRERRL